MCAKAGRRTPATIADHIVPHRGDTMLFFDPSNLQSLCDIHHRSEKQRIEAGGNARAPVGLDGWPLDPLRPSPTLSTAARSRPGVAKSPGPSEE
jgi:5-methylcytosine-specific restriction protein A